MTIEVIFQRSLEEAIYVHGLAVEVPSRTPRQYVWKDDFVQFEKGSANVIPRRL